MTKTGSTTTSCSYQATCTDSGYECDASTGLCGTKTCNSESGCNTLMNQYRSVSSTLCKTTTSQCPTTGWNMQQNVSFNGPSLSGSTCTYTPKCTNGGTLTGGSGTITCTLGGTGSTACTTDNLGTMFRPYYCPVSVTCPSVGTFGNLANGRIEEPIKPNVSTCRYQLSCDSNYTLNGYNPIECSGDTCNTNYLSSQLQQRSCQQNFSCPDASVPGGYGSILKTQTGNKCDYTLKCDTGYAYPNGTATHTCTGSACTTGTNSVTTWASGLECKAKVTCPSKVTLEHGTVTWASTKNGTECTATVNCPAPSYSCSLGDDCTRTCSGTENCELLKVHYVDHSSDACSFSCPQSDYIRTFVSSHIQNVTRTPLSDDKCKYVFYGCDRCYTSSYGSSVAKTCQKEECNSNSSGWLNDIVGFCYWSGGDGCGADQ